MCVILLLNHDNNCYITFIIISLKFVNRLQFFVSGLIIFLLYKKLGFFGAASSFINGISVKRGWILRFLLS